MVRGVKVFAERYCSTVIRYMDFGAGLPGIKFCLPHCCVTLVRLLDLYFSITSKIRLIVILYHGSRNVTSLCNMSS